MSRPGGARPGASRGRRSRPVPDESAAAKPAGVDAGIPRRTLARFAPRIGALLYEALLLLAMAFVVGFLLLPLVSPPGVGRQTLTVPPLFARTMLFCALVGASAAYYVWSWSGGRRTLPQRTWRVRLTDRRGGPLAPRQALLRYAAAAIGPAVALIGYDVLRSVGYGRNALAFVALNYCWVIIDPDRQFLHDRIAATVVINDK